MSAIAAPWANQSLIDDQDGYHGYKYQNPSNIFLRKQKAYDFESWHEQVQVGNDQEKAQSKNGGGKKRNQQSHTHTMETYRKPSEQPFTQQAATQLPKQLKM